LLGLIGFSVWAFLNRPKPAPAVFEEHFNKPKSILADLDKRYAADSSGVERPAACYEVLALADRAYTDGQLETAFNHLIDLLNEEDLLACHSDAYYFMGIILIDRGEPREAIEMFSRIDNIELYGEDIYWYQSMAFVKMAQTDGDSREIARRSLERFIENTSNPDRKMEAEKMLKDLE
jgi:tetratricopeptide (TPR) repeat protein